jgi:predicted GTPase
MAYGAGFVAAQQYGAGRLVDPRTHAVGTLVDTFVANPHLQRVLPAMGYSAQQRADLKASIEASGAEVVVDASPADIATLLHLSIPVLRVSYRWVQRQGPDLLARVTALVSSATA